MAKKVFSKATLENQIKIVNMIKIEEKETHYTQPLGGQTTSGLTSSMIKVITDKEYGSKGTYEDFCKGYHRMTKSNKSGKKRTAVTGIPDESKINLSSYHPNNLYLDEFYD